MRHDDNRRRILAAATAVFEKRDFHQVLVSEVAARAGVGKGTVYLYFPTKDELHRGALEASLERVALDVEAAAEQAAPTSEVLRQIVVVILHFFWRRPHLLTLVQRYEQRRPRRASERRRRVVRAVERALARHRIGGGGNARRLAVAFLLGLARAAILEHGADDRPEAVAVRIVDLYLHGIGSAARRQRRAA
jgi:AcrR family transcriptional regulator